MFRHRLSLHFLLLLPVFCFSAPGICNVVSVVDTSLLVPSLNLFSVLFSYICSHAPFLSACPYFVPAVLSTVLFLLSTFIYVYSAFLQITLYILLPAVFLLLVPPFFTLLSHITIHLSHDYVSLLYLPSISLPRSLQTEMLIALHPNTLTVSLRFADIYSDLQIYIACIAIPVLVHVSLRFRYVYLSYSLLYTISLELLPAIFPYR